MPLRPVYPVLALALLLPVKLSASSATAVIGHSVTFSVTSDGLDPLYFQWMKGGQPIINEVGRTYNIRSVAPGNAGDYSVMVMNEYGFTVSDTATLTVSLVEASPASSSGGGGGAAEPWFGTSLFLAALGRWWAGRRPDWQVACC